MTVFLTMCIALYLFQCHYINVRGERVRNVIIAPTRHMRVIRIEKLISTSQLELLRLVFAEIEARTAKCRVGNYLLTFTLGRNHYIVNGSTVLQVHAMDNMSSIWKCTLTDQLNSETVYMLNVRVKAAKDVQLIINGNEFQNFRLSAKSVLDYDGSTEYSCEEGATLDITCMNAYENGTVRLWYYDGIDTKLKEIKKVEAKTPLNFRLVMNAERNNSFVDCSYISIDQQIFTYRVTFMLKNNASMYSNNESQLFVIIGCVSGTVLAIFIVFGTCYWRKKRTKPLHMGKKSYKIVRECHTPVSAIPCQMTDNELYTIQEYSLQEHCTMEDNSLYYGSIPTGNVKLDWNDFNENENDYTYVEECLAKKIDMNLYGNSVCYRKEPENRCSIYANVEMRDV